MKNEVLSLIASFVAMVFVVVSYFVKKKSLYLLFQALCIMFLIVSYFFSVQFFAMIGLGIGLVRALAYFAYEQKDKNAPLWVALALAAATTASYVIVNFFVLKTAQPLDILCLLALVMYAFIFRIRNLKIVRFTMLVPTVLSILFNTLTGAAFFASLTYIFELTADVVSIYKYHIRGNDVHVKGDCNYDEREK
ncbi:MAG: YgjV family protein [Clostridia bacterium]|nr:YgjV family protein [Clostridia bacterium]